MGKGVTRRNEKVPQTLELVYVYRLSFLQSVP